MEYNYLLEWKNDQIETHQLDAEYEMSTAWIHFSGPGIVNVNGKFSISSDSESTGSIKTANAE